MLEEPSREGLTKKEVALSLGISRGSLYYQKKLPLKDEILRQQIEAVMREHSGYGYRPVSFALGISENRARRVMKKFHLRPERAAKVHKKPLDSGKEERNFPCITKLFCPIQPNIVWVSDFTFISYRGKFVHLCTIVDLFTGEILGSAIMLHHSSELVSTALMRAITSTGVAPEWFHSDQGSEYDSSKIEALCLRYGIKQSMSPKSSPWCNGMQESIFGRFKITFGDPQRFDTLEELIEALYSHVHYFTEYRIKNRLRMSPAQFRRKWEATQETLNSQASSQVMSLPPDPPHSRTQQLRLSQNSISQLTATTSFFN